MSTEPTDDERNGRTEKNLTFREQLEELEEPINTAIDETVRKIESGRIYDAENESVRIKRKRALGYLIRTKLKVLEARELEELEERLAALEEAEKEEPDTRL